MRITDVETLVRGNLHFVRIKTDSEIYGIGQSGCWAYPTATDALITEFKKFLIGADPLAIEKHWQRFFRMGPFRSAIITAAISAVDIALWDIKGKYFKAPVWQLLGGLTRDRLRLMLLMGRQPTPDDVAAAFKKAVSNGYTAIKFDPMPEHYMDLSTSALVAGVARNVEAARDGAGADVDVVVELHRSLTPLQVGPVFDALAKYRLLFIEDPIQIDSISEQSRAALKSQSAVALGERWNSLWEFNEQLQQAGPVYLRADLGLSGGITHCQKIAALADAYYSAPVWHNCLGPVLNSATSHLSFAIPNFLVLEYLPFMDPGAMPGISSSFARDGGYLLPSELPGLGVDLNDAQIPTINMLGRPIHEMPLRLDGSIGSAI